MSKSPKGLLEKQRWAVTRVFFLAGLFTASWVPHIPYVKAKHGLSDGTLGLVLLAMGLGAVFAMLTAGAVSARLGPEVLARWGTFVLATAVPLPLIAPNIGVLVAVLVFYGASWSDGYCHECCCSRHRSSTWAPYHVLGSWAL